MHAKGSFIYLQLAAIGRVGGIGEASVQELLSASNIPMTGLPAPRPLTHAKIEEFVEAFATSAYNAVHKAGFDGVEVHGGAYHLENKQKTLLIVLPRSQRLFDRPVHPICLQQPHGHIRRVRC